MAQHTIELMLWLLLAFFVGGIAGCLLRWAAASRAAAYASAGDRLGSARSTGLPPVEPSGTAAPRPRAAP